YEIDDAPAWATVHTLLGAVPGSDACRTSSLRRLLNVDRRGIARLATLTRPLDVAVLQWDGPNARFDDAVYEVQDTRGEDAYTTLAALERITVLPRLRRLELRGHAWWHADPAGLPT